MRQDIRSRALTLRISQTQPSRKAVLSTIYVPTVAIWQAYWQHAQQNTVLVSVFIRGECARLSGSFNRIFEREPMERTPMSIHIADVGIPQQRAHVTGVPWRTPSGMSAMTSPSREDAGRTNTDAVPPCHQQLCQFKCFVVLKYWFRKGDDSITATVCRAAPAARML